MRPSGLLAASLGVGLLLAGIANAALAALVPPALRSAPMIWGTTAVIVAATTAAVWAFFGPRKG